MNVKAWATRLAAVGISGYSTGRTLTYATEMAILVRLSRLAPIRKKIAWQRPEPAAIRHVQRLATAFLREDAENIVRGLYPLGVLKPESPLRHARRYARIAWDGFHFEKRRAEGKTAQFASDAQPYLNGLPRYYQRNFHFQTNGYLSDLSAQLWDHQVELTFAGLAGAMRRLIIPALSRHFASRAEPRGRRMKSQAKEGSRANAAPAPRMPPSQSLASPEPLAERGRGLKFLEIGCGPGSATRDVRLAFPQAKIVAVDLSAPYLNLAERNLAGLARVDFLQADGARLPFADAQFDAVYSVFLFHELPEAVRAQIVRESRRVLRPGGFLGAVDSVQLGDVPGTAEMLENFPKNYHEPYYRNYVRKPLEKLFRSEGLKRVGARTGFLSKVVWGTV